MLLPDETYEQAKHQNFLISFGGFSNLIDINDIDVKNFSKDGGFFNETDEHREEEDDDFVSRTEELKRNSIIFEERDESTGNSDESCSQQSYPIRKLEERQRLGLGDGPSEPHEGYDKTSQFFDNIPEFQGETLGPFSINNKSDFNIRTNIDLLRACEVFLMKHRIRPDFFCKYRPVAK